MAAFPPPPTSKIDWANVGFKVHEVNGHVESHYSVATGKWSPLAFVTDPYIRIHGMAPALNYGQQAFEGIKAFRLPEDKGIAIFRPDKNAARMAWSAEVVSIPPVPRDLFVDACKAAVALNAEWVPPHETGQAMYVRPQIYGSSAQLGLAPPEEYMFCVYVMPTGTYHGSHPVKCLITDDADRAAPKGTGNAKIGGNYAPPLKWMAAARAQGFSITLHLDSLRHEEVDEFTTSGFVGALVDEAGAVTLVVPDTKCAIKSVTSESVQDLGRSFGWKVEERPVRYEELPDFKEVMAAGTAAALVPIRSITRRLGPANPKSFASTSKSHPRVKVGEKEELITYIPESEEDAGPICMKLLTTLQGVQRGKLKDDFGWRFDVTEQDLSTAEAKLPHLDGHEQSTKSPAVGQMD